MNTIQIQEVLSNDQFSKKYFKNVLAIDELPKTSKKIKNLAFIINKDKKTEKGEHCYLSYTMINQTANFLTL